jgi:K+-transporting ATPase ATPase C chain
MKKFLVALRALALLTFITGFIYPVVVGLAGRTLFPRQAEGSLLLKQGVIVGSSLLAQETKGARYFHPRPSAVNYGLPSGGSNLGPTSATLKKAFNDRMALGEIASASASGLDPHISPEEALAQVDRVAKARGILKPALLQMVERATLPRTVGILGMPMVNVLELNLSLDEAN